MGCYFHWVLTSSPVSSTLSTAILPIINHIKSLIFAQSSFSWAWKTVWAWATALSKYHSMPIIFERRALETDRSVSDHRPREASKRTLRLLPRAKMWSDGMHTWQGPNVHPIPIVWLFALQSRSLVDSMTWIISNDWHNAYNKSRFAPKNKCQVDHISVEWHTCFGGCWAAAVN